MDNTKNDILELIEKYRNEKYSERDFQNSLNIIINMITSISLNELRQFLIYQEGALESINFLVNKNKIRAEYLKILDEIEKYIAKNLT